MFLIDIQSNSDVQMQNLEFKSVNWNHWNSLNFKSDKNLDISFNDSSNFEKFKLFQKKSKPSFLFEIITEINFKGRNNYKENINSYNSPIATASLRANIEKM